MSIKLVKMSKVCVVFYSGVLEIRIHTGVEHRVFYVAKFQEAVYVLHAFEKKRHKTSKQDIELGRARLSELLAQLHKNQK